MHRYVQAQHGVRQGVGNSGCSFHLSQSMSTGKEQVASQDCCAAHCGMRAAADTGVHAGASKASGQHAGTGCGLRSVVRHRQSNRCLQRPLRAWPLRRRRAGREQQLVQRACARLQRAAHVAAARRHLARALRRVKHVLDSQPILLVCEQDFACRCLHPAGGAHATHATARGQKGTAWSAHLLHQLITLISGNP